jgi:hypothetical protein
VRRPFGILAAALTLGLAVTGTAAAASHGARHRGHVTGSQLPTGLPPVRLTVPAYGGRYARAYAQAARLFTQPFLVAADGRGWSLLNAVVGRGFAGTYLVAAGGQVHTLAGPNRRFSTPEDAYAVTLTYRAPQEDLTVTETRLLIPLSGPAVTLAGRTVHLTSGRDGKVPILTAALRVDNLSLKLTARKLSSTRALMGQFLSRLRAARS